MDKVKVRVAIVGCGVIGNIHAQNTLQIPELEIAACVDLVEERAQKLLTKLAHQGYTSSRLERVLEDPNIDALLVCTRWGNRGHTNIIKAAAQAGKQVFVEKPLAATPEECNEIEAAVNQSGITLMTGYCLRFAPLVSKAREIVDIPLLFIAQCTDRYESSIIDNGCHLFDLACWFNQVRPVAVAAMGNAVTQNFEARTYGIDHLACTLKFPSGTIASITLGALGLNPHLSKFSLQLFGPGLGVALVDRFRHLEAWGTELESITYRIGTYNRGRHGYMGHYEELKAFARCLLEDSPSPVPVAEGRLATDIMAAALTSAGATGLCPA